MLSGDVVVKVLRVATGKNIGPGTYPVANTDMAQRQKSHNIKGVKHFQDLESIGKRKRSLPRPNENEEQKLVDSFYDLQKTSLHQLFQGESSTKGADKCSLFQVNRRNSPAWTKRGQARYNISLKDSESQVCNQTITTANESREAQRKKDMNSSLRSAEWGRQPGPIGRQVTAKGRDKETRNDLAVSSIVLSAAPSHENKTSTIGTGYQDVATEFDACRDSLSKSKESN